MKRFEFCIGLGVLALLFAAAGCGEDLESISEISKFRVMAVQADPPDTRPEEPTTLRILWADPDGDGRPVRFFWFAVAGQLSPSSSFEEAGLVVGYCEPRTAAEGGDSCRIGPLPEQVLEDPSIEPLLRGNPDDPYLPVTVIVGACAGGELPDVKALFESDELRDIESYCAGGEGVLSFKSYRVSESPAPNRNPQLVDMTFGDEPLRAFGETAGPDGGMDGGMDAGMDAQSAPPSPGLFVCEDNKGCRKGETLETRVTKESYQLYTVIEYGEPVRKVESPYVSWFTTGGDFDADRSRAVAPTVAEVEEWLTGDFKDDPAAGEAPWDPIDNTWSPPRQGGVFELWAVAHDLRGGASWKKYLLEARVPDEE